MRLPLIIFSLCFSFGVSAQKLAYQLFDSTGKAISWDQLLSTAQQADVILFGELHNNPIAHWLQLELTTELYRHNPALVLGAEMLESDNQLILDEYLLGKISEKSFTQEMRLWSNHNTDYQPLVDFAKTNHLRFIATNVPRRYANLVYKQGFEALDSLSPQAKRYIAPLPMRYDSTLSMYREMVANSGGHGGANMPKAQAVKDATMAHFISSNLPKNGHFIHFHGSYHSDNFEGIYWYLKQSSPKLKIFTIATVEQASVATLSEDSRGQAEIILVVPETMTKTH